MYRERTDTRERISGWHPLIVKCVAVTWLTALVGFLAWGVMTCRQMMFYSQVIANDSKLRLEKFELEHPKACGDVVMQPGNFSDPEPCPAGTRFEPYPGDPVRFVCKCVDRK